MELQNIKGVASLLVNGLEALIFPQICVCCGNRHVGADRTICGYCLDNRFELGNPLFEANILGHIIPDGIEWIHALWKFDKGGSLQELIHKLKYQHQQRIGVDFGRKLGENLLLHPQFRAADKEQYILLPVPLHRRRLRIRGYNQAAAIAEGVSECTGIEMPESDIVTRVRYTSSQTGLNGVKRQRNIENAFRINEDKRAILHGRNVIIVDDIITTGATVLEISRLIINSGTTSVAILTVGMA